RWALLHQWSDGAWVSHSVRDNTPCIPELILFLVSIHGDVGMLQWCEEMRVLVCYDCSQCGSGPCPREGGWGRVPRDAAAAGHVDMVMYCLDRSGENPE
ncbi:unnamed protein product, partial [Pylaiella littoralis]